ncbi:MAG: penicillin acylase family protein [Planctomycetes bacterium]|nr:penicillin acylase family protein [Planctomycetota bacterium]
MKPLTLKFARRRVTAARDEAGVPHITADSFQSALYGLGYLHAFDRPTQMLFARTIAQGRGAELIADSPELVETDTFFRRAGLYLNLEQEVRRLDDLAFAQMTAYCEGVNDGMKQAGRSLPMWATGFQPSPWDQQAILLVGNLLNYNGLVVSQQQNERLLAELIQVGVRRDLLTEMFAPVLDHADFDMLRQIRLGSRLSNSSLELITDLPRLIGSNAWAVAPSRSASGHALLASDPHLEVNRLPAIWYEAVLRWGDEYLMGATLPGCPLFAVGRNPELAWGVTYFKADTSDYFVEDCRRQDGIWQYRRGSEWRDFTVRREIIARKEGPPVEVDVFESPQGTLEVDLRHEQPGLYLSTAWTGASEGVGESMATWLRLTECRKVHDAMMAVRTCPQPSLMWVFADGEGHIGRQANGWVPRRPKHVIGVLPIAAWDEANHWQGWLPVEYLPSDYDPPAGFVATANENPCPGDFALVTQALTDYRKRRIDERLKELPQATLADMQALQYDVLSVQARDLMAVFLPHLPEGEARNRLAAWDYQYDPESLEATLFARLYRNVLVEVFGQDTERTGGLGWRRMVYLISRVGFSMMVVTNIDRMLKQERSLWWEGRDKGELIHRAAEALEVEPDQAWGVTNAFRITNRYFESQFVGRALGFHTSDLPMRGCHATPFQGHLLRAGRRETTFAPSYHFVTDLGADEAFTNLPGGPSESWLSRWYKSDLSRWLAGEYKRLGGHAEGD